MPTQPVDEVTDLLQQLIRNACVNDGSAASGHEVRSADLLEGYLEGTALDLERYEPMPGRASLIARLPGTDPTAPTLLLMGHTDVVPVSPDGWSRDPHGGELVDGVVWGRGAVDMLNLTSSMAVALRRLARSGWRPRGTLVYLAVADEEAGGQHGAEWLTTHERDAVTADYVITESGGIPVDTPAGRRLWVMVGEKGVSWYRLRVRGTPGHGSRPLRTDNALVKAAEVVRRLAAARPDARVDDVWRAWVMGMGFEPPVRDALLDPARVWEGIDQLPLTLARIADACTHMTVAPTVIHGGRKTNVIPDEVELQIDIRKLPGQTADDVRRFLDDVLAELRDSVEVSAIADNEGSVSPIDTPLWDALSRASAVLHPDAVCIPSLTTGGTDARFFRELGIPAYGYGLVSQRLGLEEYSAMFHGNNERIDQESLRLATELWEAVARDLLG
ncbi:MAG: M20/M25/M40 family metallo-hydrolase [Candidatus Dormibacteria bacterium]